MVELHVCQEQLLPVWSSQRVFKIKVEKNLSVNIVDLEIAEREPKGFGMKILDAGILNDVFLYEQHLKVSMCVISTNVGVMKVYNG